MNLCISDLRPLVSFDRTATVAAGGTTSQLVDLDGETLVGIFVPSTFDGTQFTLKASPLASATPSTVQAAVTADTAFTVTTAAGRYVPIDPAIAAGIRHVQIVCTTSQSSTDTVFTLATRPV